MSYVAACRAVRNNLYNSEALYKLGVDIKNRIDSDRTDRIDSLVTF